MIGFTIRNADFAHLCGLSEASSLNNVISSKIPCACSDVVLHIYSTSLGFTDDHLSIIFDKSSVKPNDVEDLTMFWSVQISQLLIYLSPSHSCAQGILHYP